MSSNTTPAIFNVDGTGTQGFSIIKGLVPNITARSSHAVLLPLPQDSLLLSPSSLPERAHSQLRVCCTLAFPDVTMLSITLLPSIVTRKRKGNELCANVRSLQRAGWASRVTHDIPCYKHTKQLAFSSLSEPAYFV